MTKKVYDATITFTVDKNHPDIQYIKNPNSKMEFQDTYYIDTEYYNGSEDILNFIKSDLALVAGGGYDTEHIHNVDFSINQRAFF